ncbi:MAG: acyl-CoA dehydrogenase family protein [Pseudorhodoplanes sp.]
MPTSAPEWLSTEQGHQVLEDLLDASDRSILDTVDHFILDELEPRAAEIDQSEEFPRDLYRKAADLGFFALAIPEKYGGLEVRLLTQFLMTERLSRSSPTFALIVTTCPDALVAIRLAGSEELKSEILPKAAEGKLLPALSLSEPGGGSDLAALRATATRDGDHYVLNGTKAWCTHGSISDVITIFAKTDLTAGSRGLSAFVVPAKTHGLEFVRNERLMGLRGAPTTQLAISGMRIPASRRLGAEGDGSRLARWALDEARLNAAAQGLGVAHRCFAEAIAYARQRHAFGKPIIEHQGLEFLFAELATEIAAARELWLRAILLLEKERSHIASMYASMAKNMCSAVGMRMTIEAIQVFGAIGLSRDLPLERFMRDVKAFQIFDGPTQIQNMIVGRHLARFGLPVW